MSIELNYITNNLPYKQVFLENAGEFDPSFIKDIPSDEINLKEYKKIYKFYEKYRIDNNNNLNQYFTSVTRNQFANSFLSAYFSHGNILISPDDLNIQLNLIISQIINKYPEELRNNFVDFKDKEDILVELNRNNLYDKNKILDDKIKYIMENEIDNITHLIKNKIKSNNIIEISKNNFSTSDKYDVLCSTLTLMESMKSYFRYRLTGGCGIRNAIFLGKLDDYTKLREKIDLFDKILISDKLKKEDKNNIYNWISNIKNIFDNFIMTYNGNPDLNFWHDIAYHEVSKEGYPGNLVDTTFSYAGWIKYLSNYENSIDKKVSLGALKNITSATDVTIELTPDASEVKELQFCVSYSDKIYCENETFRPNRVVSVIEKNGS